jgi:hypothetical protein
LPCKFLRCVDEMAKCPSMLNYKVFWLVYSCASQ